MRNSGQTVTGSDYRFLTLRINLLSNCPRIQTHYARPAQLNEETIMFSYSLNSLIVFYEVAKLNSFSKAADLLFITQPGVSKHVAQIEAQAGCRLIKRENGVCTLTKEGKIVFKYAEKIEAMARGLETVIRNIRQEPAPLLRVATTPVYSRIMVPFILGTFQKDNPDVMIKLDTGSSGDLIKTLSVMENDVVIVATEKIPQNLAEFSLVKEELVAIVPRNHPLAGKDSISLREIDGYPMIVREKESATRKTVLSALEAVKAKPSVLIDMKSTDFIKEWVSQGKGLSILIKRAVLPEDLKHFKVLSLKEKLSLDVYVVFLKSRKYDLAIRRFVHHIEELKLKYVL